VLSRSLTWRGFKNFFRRPSRKGEKEAASSSRKNRKTEKGCARKTTYPGSQVNRPLAEEKIMVTEAKGTQYDTKAKQDKRKPTQQLRKNIRKKRRA